MLTTAKHDDPLYKIDATLYDGNLFGHHRHVCHQLGGPRAIGAESSAQQSGWRL